MLFTKSFYFMLCFRVNFIHHLLMKHASHREAAGTLIRRQRRTPAAVVKRSVDECGKREPVFHKGTSLRSNFYRSPQLSLPFSIARAAPGLRHPVPLEGAYVSMSVASCAVKRRPARARRAGHQQLKRLHSRTAIWCALQDLNLRSPDYRSAALPAELRAHIIFKKLPAGLLCPSALHPHPCREQTLLSWQSIAAGSPVSADGPSEPASRLIATVYGSHTAFLLRGLEVIRRPDLNEYRIPTQPFSFSFL